MGIYSVQENILNEIYFGKTDDINELQSILSNLRQDIRENRYNGNVSKYNLEFNRKTEDIFGFGAFSLDIIYDNQVNAFTMPLGMKFDVWNEKFKPTKNSFRFDKSAGYSCVTFIYVGLLMDEKFTDREIMAIILHEIGHNFQGSLNKNSFVFNSIKKSLYGISLIIEGLMHTNPLVIVKALTNTSLFEKLSIKIDRFIAKNLKGLQIFSDFITEVFSTISSIFSTIALLSNPFAVLIRIILSSILKYNPISLAMAFMGYNNEKLSDDFAATYGYGPELSSALLKMDFKYSTKTPLLDRINEFFTIPYIILASPADEHPQTFVRCKEIITYLEDELNNNVKDPKMKEKIKSEINETIKLMDDTLNRKNSDEETRELRLAYNAYMYTKFGGGIKEALLKANNNEIIDKSYKNALDKIEMK